MGGQAADGAAISIAAGEGTTGGTSSTGNNSGEVVNVITMTANFVLGLKDASVSVLNDTWEIITHSWKIVEGVAFIAKAVIPGTDENKLIVEIVTQTVNKFWTGNGNTKARMLGRLLGELLIGMVSTKGLTAAVDLLKGATRAGKIGDILAPLDRETSLDSLINKLNEANVAGRIDEVVEEAVRLSKYEEMSSGAVKGMFSKMSVSEWLRLEDLAETMYNSFRTRVDDIAKISKNIGWDERKITQIKKHLFNEEHLFNDGTKRLFDANYWQAEAWERLINGTATETDKLLLNHELFESNYIKAHNCTYEVAHEEANKLYNWSKEVFGE